MIDILSHYIPHSLPPVRCFQEDPDFRFETAPNLALKIASDGTINPFPGNTVVFRLHRAEREQLSQLQDRLYQRCSHLLAQPLNPDTFHMTLHDLANGPESPETRRWMAETAPRATAFLKQLKEEYSAPLSLRGTWLFNMVNTSIVLGLEPVCGCAAQLDALYCRFHEVVPLNYAMTPHITLAYFKPGRYSLEELSPLRQVLCPVEFSTTFEMRDLEFQTFQDMDHYAT